MENYTNKKPYNNIAPKAGEQLVPVLAYELVKWNDDCVRNRLAAEGQLLNKNNLETWHLGGRKILVGFVAVPDTQAEAAIQAFRDDTNEYIESTRKKRCLIANEKGELIRCPKCNNCDECDDKDNPDRIISRTVSIDKITDDSIEEGAKGFDPAGTTANEDIAFLIMNIHMLIDELSSQDKNYGKIIRLLAEGYGKGEILDILKLNKGKTQAYAYISKVQKIAKELYDKKYR